jgi:dipeptide transport system ATP-binding protein
VALVEVRQLRVEFPAEGFIAPAVDGFDLELDAAQIVAVVGESGSGKSAMALALMGLIEAPGRVSAQRMHFAGTDLLRAGESTRRGLLGKSMAMIFQDPSTSLDPCYTVGFQLGEALRAHARVSAAQARSRSLALLKSVEIAEPAARLGAYAHQLSGGMAQRVMIAMAIAHAPRLLLADEPTTALDVTVQAQILELLCNLQRERDMALLLISHDLALVADVAQRVIVMYAGQEVEQGAVPEMFDVPRHPYTRALLDALPERNAGRSRIAAIGGAVPGPRERPAGCLFAPRCAFALQRCHRERPLLEAEGARRFRCHYPLDARGTPTRGWRPEAAGGPA